MVSKTTFARVFLFALFVGMSLILSQVAIDPIIGTNMNFKAFNAFTPAVGGIAGGLLGFACVLGMQVFGLALGTFKYAAQPLLFGLIPLGVLAFLPMALSALYFGSKGKKSALISVACILLFLLHPTGREVWYFSLFWVIPLIAAYVPRFRLISQALGATFTDHAVGSVMYLYLLNLPAAMWIAAIPLIPFERGAFAAGIALSYLALFNLLRAADSMTMRFANVSLLKLFRINENYDGVVSLNFR
ncbi:MAG: hypothetical protein ABIH99_03355 [Candidatus Micrarchaeota archaeon]